MRLLEDVGWDVTDSGCWEVRGYRDRYGYGRLRSPGVDVKAHRLAYETWVGPIPDGLHVLHSCDNPPCINPEHLRAGTQAENLRDMAERGRSSRGMAKLTWAEVRAIRAIRATGKVSQSSIAWGFGVSTGTISEIVTNKIWREVA